jgi:hypothetical protein
VCVCVCAQRRRTETEHGDTCVTHTVLEIKAPWFKYKHSQEYKERTSQLFSISAFGFLLIEFLR